MLLGGMLTLDRMAFGQFFLSRPLFAATLLGYVLHCPAEGAFIGFVYELLFLRSIPAGSFIPFHPLHGSLIAVLLIATGSAGTSGWQAVPVAVFFSLPAIFLDRYVEIVWRRSNERNLLKATALVRMGKVGYARGVHLISILRAFFLNIGAVLLSGIILSVLCTLALSRFPFFTAYLSVAGLTPFFIGLAGVTSGRKFEFGRISFLCGLLLGALAGSGILL
jgi:PTS system mannose-specific IIC component